MGQQTLRQAATLAASEVCAKRRRRPASGSPVRRRRRSAGTATPSILGDPPDTRFAPDQVHIGEAVPTQHEHDREIQQDLA
jgi:hypothetical protein